MTNVFGLLPPEDQDEAFIAGGFVACPAMAGDIDLWVPIAPWEDLDQARERLLAYFQSTTGIIRNVAYGCLPHVDVEEGGANDPRYMINTLKVARISRTQGLSVHVLVTTGHVQSVIEAFDISTHALAMTRFGVITASSWTPITQEPVVRRGSVTSLERVNEIRTRYGYTPLNVLPFDAEGIVL